MAKVEPDIVQVEDDDEMPQIEAKTEVAEKKPVKIPPASICKLFSKMDTLEVIVLLVGCLGAIGNGLSQPLLCIVFGDLIDGMGELVRWHGDDVARTDDRDDGRHDEPDGGALHHHDAGWRRRDLRSIPAGSLLQDLRREAGIQVPSPLLRLRAPPGRGLVRHEGGCSFAGGDQR